MWRSGGDATIDQPARRRREQAQEREEKRPNADADVGEPLMWVPPDGWDGWDNEWMTSFRGWKGLTRHHLRCSPPREVRFELETAELRHLQTTRLHHRIA